MFLLQLCLYSGSLYSFLMRHFCRPKFAICCRNVVVEKEERDEGLEAVQQESC